MSFALLLILPVLFSSTSLCMDMYVQYIYTYIYIQHIYMHYISTHTQPHFVERIV